MLGPLERANLSHWVTSRWEIFIPHLKMEIDPVPETLCSLECLTMGKDQKPSNPELFSFCFRYDEVSFHIVIFQIMISCNLTDGYQRFGRAYCLQLQGINRYLEDDNNFQR
jgi:hypothetical protein